MRYPSSILAVQSIIFASPVDVAHAFRYISFTLKELNLYDRRQLEAAEGWLGLGNWLEAGKELEQMSPAMQARPDVLGIRWQIHAAAKRWEPAMEIARAIATATPESPLGWIHWAYALHELKRTREAYEVASAVAAKFPKETTLHYNLACYACQLGKLEEAKVWLKQAMAIAGQEEIRTTALSDPDLKPLWKQIGKM